MLIEIILIVVSAALCLISAGLLLSGRADMRKHRQLVERPTQGRELQH